MDGYIFNDYDEVKEIVKNNPEYHVYTLVSGDNDTDWIYEGYRIVNRWGYMIAKKKIDIPDICIRFS